MPLKTLHVYCRVVDNFGDAGVCWRLARQLAREHALDVTLWIDRPAVLARLVPDLTLNAAPGGALVVRPWPEAEPDDAWPDVAVCAFGCDPPAWLRTRLAGGPVRPLWINLEYLSAEHWVDGCHGLASIKSADGAREHFYFPGFRATTGGLAGERGLLAARDAFRAGGAAAAWWQAHDLPDPPGRRVSIFCYPDAPLVPLLRAMAEGGEPTLALVAGGAGGDALSQWLNGLDKPTQEHRLPRWQAGKLTLVRLPMLPIDDYDRLLWSCEVNFVRGEDSWVRGLWAGRPMVWQPYRQTDQAHRIKLDAFLDWQAPALAGLDPAARTAVSDLSHAWSDGTDPGPAWIRLTRALPSLAVAFDALSRETALQDGLAERLVRFCNSRL
ncbi:MAG TPA: elongation factor P maturation arginine rhamnosyltransferase EarP [Burkholderiaceae bacterium]|nr:elongation factor P maturation arginine rhamnosyltransferase EarP [Burkholderiaceae bacterium]